MKIIASTSGKSYTVEIFKNTSGRNRGFVDDDYRPSDELLKLKISCDSDLEAMREAFEEIEDVDFYFDDPDEFYELSENDLRSMFDDVDTTSGAPIVLRIRKGSKEIYRFPEYREFMALTRNI